MHGRTVAERRIVIIGAGLAGALLATLLARRGWSVDVYEKRGDPRVEGYAGGRSINLALAERGIHALRQAGALDAVMARAVMMRGRMVHDRAGRTELQPYGRDDSEVIWSVSRSGLNIELLGIAEAAGARMHFDCALESVDFEARTADFVDVPAGTTLRIEFRALIGADGAGSCLRAAMRKVTDLGEQTEFLDHSYKELEIPPAPDGAFTLEPHALHIWPRGRYMCIALPNAEGTFTVSLFLPNRADVEAGVPGFDTVRTGGEARVMFAEQFADALPLMPRLEHDYDHNPVGLLGTLYLDRWHLDGRAVLLGDAAHAMVPFHGQGMNCAFEDCIALAEQLDAHSDFNAAFAAFQAERLPNSRAIQAMALENYLEMRDKVADDSYQLQRELELALAERHPDRFMPRYSMVTFQRMPYAVAYQRGQMQRQLLVDLTTGHASLDTLDWSVADAEVHRRLSPLHANAPEHSHAS